MTLPRPGDRVCAGIDVGLVADSSALVIVHERASILHVGEIVELRPQKDEPLKPSEVIRSFAKTMLAHGVSFAVGDRHYAEAVREYLDEFDLSLAFGPTSPAEAYVRTRALMREGRVRIPKHDRLIQQLREVQGKPTSGGGMSITHPRSVNGGHGDIAAAFVLAVWQISGDSIAEVAPEFGTREWEEAAANRRRAKHREETAEKPAWMPKNKTGERFA